MSRAIVIPARRGASRLPDKPLLAETGRPLIAHCVERALAAEGFACVIVATDDEAIAAAAEAAGARGVLTRADHPSGTDRVAEAAASLDAEIIVNLQGDEPEIEPSYLARAAGLLADGAAEMATLVTPLDPALLDDPAAVKAVVAGDRALYFSRAAVPHQRDADGPPPPRFLHLGVYAYRRDALLAWPSMPPSPLERCEKLEQLRALEAGWTIRVAQVPSATPGIDTPADYAAFVARWRANAPGDLA